MKCSLAISITGNLWSGGASKTEAFISGYGGPKLPRAVPYSRAEMGRNYPETLRGGFLGRPCACFDPILFTVELVSR